MALALLNVSGDRGLSQGSAIASSMVTARRPATRLGSASSSGWGAGAALPRTLTGRSRVAGQALGDTHPLRQG